MIDNYQGTGLDNTKGQSEFDEVEALIKATLAETKTEEKKIEPKPAPVAPAPVKPVAQPQPTNQPVEKKYEETFHEYQAGDIVKGTVIKVDQGGVLVDIKYKADGFVPTEELTERGTTKPQDVVKVGDVIDVLIENLENKEGYVLLSKKNADQEVKWKKAFTAYKNKSVLTGEVLQALAGGLVIDCGGMRGFIPASQVKKQAEETLESFKGKTLSVKVIEINQRQGKIVMSHKMAGGEEKSAAAQKILDELEVGQVRKGTVSSLKSFGAFVDLGGLEGLIHLSELAWKRVKHPSEAVKVGQQLDVFVLGVDRVNKKISLGLKELLPDPWEQAAKFFKPGSIVKAKVVRFAKFGAFAELSHDLEGLIHNTELARDPVLDPSEAVKIGETYDVKVLRVLPEEQKIGLSIKAVLIMKEREEAKQQAPAPTETPAEPETKVTIGDMIAHKSSSARRERASEDSESSEAPTDVGA